MAEPGRSKPATRYGASPIHVSRRFVHPFDGAGVPIARRRIRNKCQRRQLCAAFAASSARSPMSFRTPFKRCSG